MFQTLNSMSLFYVLSLWVVWECLELDLTSLEGVYGLSMCLGRKPSFMPQILLFWGSNTPRLSLLIVSKLKDEFKGMFGTILGVYGPRVFLGRKLLFTPHFYVFKCSKPEIASP